MTIYHRTWQGDIIQQTEVIKTVQSKENKENEERKKAQHKSTTLKKKNSSNQETEIQVSIFPATVGD